MTAGRRPRAWVLAASVALSTVALGAEPPARIERQIAPGQDALMAALLGAGRQLPGGCRFTGGTAANARITAGYDCAGANVVVELLHPADAAAEDLRTDRFAVRLRGGAAPPGLLAAVGDLIRARESEFVWTAPTVSSASPVTLVVGVLALIGLGLLVQIAVDRRVVSPAAWPVGQPPALGGGPMLIAVGVIGAYALTRTLALNALPVFTDEAMHIAWVRQCGLCVTPGELAVGKSLPVQIMRLFALLPLAPLVSARLASVCMGLAALLACMLIDRELFAWREGLVAGVLYTVLPFALLYDRLALADIYVSACTAWAVLCAIRMITRRGRSRAYGAGVLLATCAAILAKPTGGIFIAAPLLVALLADGRPQRRAYLLRLVPALATATGLLALLVSAGYGSGLLETQSASRFDWRQVAVNIDLLDQWLMALLSPLVFWPTAAAVLWAVAAAFRGGRREPLLAALLLLATVPYVVAAGTWFPRYVLFAGVPICLLLARAITAASSALRRMMDRRRSEWGAVGDGIATALAVTLLAGSCLPLDFALLADPASAGLPPAERAQYVSGWTSGFGLPELAAFLRAQADGEAINVARFAGDGPPRQGLDVYLSPSPALRVVTIEQPEAVGAALLRDLTQSRRTFFVCNSDGDRTRLTALWQQLGKQRRVWQYTRPGSDSGLELWELTLPARSPDGGA